MIASLIFCGAFLYSSKIFFSSGIKSSFDRSKLSGNIMRLTLKAEHIFRNVFSEQAVFPDSIFEKYPWLTPIFLARAVDVIFLDFLISLSFFNNSMEFIRMEVQSKSFFL